MTIRRRKYRIVSPVRFFLFVTTVVLMLTFAVVSFSSASAINAEDSTVAATETYKLVEVHQNDTIWDLADRYCDPMVDNRILVDEICEINDIEPGDLQPGDTILVPVVA